jgi:hypothetical protein
MGLTFCTMRPINPSNSQYNTETKIRKKNEVGIYINISIWCHEEREVFQIQAKFLFFPSDAEVVFPYAMFR